MPFLSTLSLSSLVSLAALLSFVTMFVGGHAWMLRRSARLRRLPLPPAWSGGIAVYETRENARLIGLIAPATAFGFGRLGIIVVSGAFRTFPPTIQRTILRHEQAHVEQFHVLGKSALLAIVFTGLAAVPADIRLTWFGCLLLVTACALTATFSRWTEYQADLAVRHHMGHHDALAMLTALDESAWYRRLEWLPGFSLLYPHPSLATRCSRLYWEISE